MSNRIDATFEKLRSKGEKAFVAYVSAGDPDLERSLQIMIALAEAGADILELGVPFSDPLADGVVNQAAAARALAAGSNSSRVFELIRRFRQSHEIPIVLFTYLNPVYTYGYSAYHEDAAQAGADGILLLDLPPDEAAQNCEMADSAGLKQIRLIAPTTPPNRVELLAKMYGGRLHLRALENRGDWLSWWSFRPDRRPRCCDQKIYGCPRLCWIWNIYPGSSRSCLLCFGWHRGWVRNRKAGRTSL